MSGMQCLSCGAETSNGLALCEACRAQGSVIVEYLPVYFRNLARWRPGRAGSRAVPGSRTPSSLGRDDSASDAVSRALDEAGNAITTWARMLEDDRPQIVLPDGGDEAATVVELCRLFAEHLTTIATLEWCGEFLADLSTHEYRLRLLTERVAPGWYAGECKRCETPTHVIPGLTWVTCNGCGATTYARDHLETILEEARGWVDKPIQIAAFIVAVVDRETNVLAVFERIRKWDQRKQLAAERRLDRDGDPVGPKLYRFGAVLDRIEAEDATRPSPVGRQSRSAS